MDVGKDFTDSAISGALICLQCGSLVPDAETDYPWDREGQERSTWAMNHKIWHMTTDRNLHQEEETKKKGPDP